jgi:hypothetical protein
MTPLAVENGVGKPAVEAVEPKPKGNGDPRKNLGEKPRKDAD